MPINSTILSKSLSGFIMHEISLVNFTDLSLDEKVMVLEWRNHESIRKWMFNQEEIALNNHLNYIDDLATKEDRIYFLVKVNNEPIGVIDFTNINLIQADIGLYAKPNLRGVGSKLMESIISYGFTVLKVDTLISEVFEENKSAIRLYKKFAFKERSRRENIMVMELEKVSYNLEIEGE